MSFHPCIAALVPTLLQPKSHCARRPRRGCLTSVQKEWLAAAAFHGVNPTSLLSSPTASFFAFLPSFQGGWRTTWGPLVSFPAGFPSPVGWVPDRLVHLSDVKPTPGFLCIQSLEISWSTCICWPFPWSRELPCGNTCTHVPTIPGEVKGWELPHGRQGTCPHLGCCCCYRFPGSRVLGTFPSSPFHAM